MGQTLEMVKNTWISYWGEGWQYWLPAVTFFYVLLRKKEKENRKLMAGYPLLCLCIFAFPVTAKIIGSYCVGELVYWRMLWLLPAGLLIAYGFTRIWQDAGNKFLKAALALAMAAAIICSGKFMYLDGNYTTTTNWQKVSPEAAMVCEILKGQQEPGETLRVAAASDVATYLRVYDPSILMPFGREGRGMWNQGYQPLYESLKAEEPDVNRVIEIARKGKWKYLVQLVKKEEVPAAFLSQGYESLGQVGTYYIFKDTRM